MIKLMQSILVLTLLACTAAWGQAARKDPHIGYVYPAGGACGATIEVTVGGQMLRGAKDVYVSGEGIQGTVVKFFPPLGNVKKEEYEELVRVMKELREKRMAEKEGRAVANADDAKPAEMMTDEGETVGIPQHPLLYKLEEMSLRQLDHVQHEIVYYRRRQMNAQIAESVVVQLSIAPDAAPGSREIRIVTPAGLTNPMRFEVSAMHEARELEPNEAAVYTPRVQDPPETVPVVFNGQIQPGDVDRLRFHARKGQHLVLCAEARQLIPYLADAVPGWFQATLTVYDSRGHEVAYSDDYQFRPDPVILFEVPKDDDYEVEIRDSIYRGRDDFVYRVVVSEQPFIIQMFPLGTTSGNTTLASLSGWNLASSQLRLSADTEGPAIRETRLKQGALLSNAMDYEVSALTNGVEAEPNDSFDSPQQVTAPLVVDGRIDRPGDADIYAIEGQAGQEVVAEIVARRLGSPLDSMLRVMDAGGKVIAANDDTEDPGAGLLTHHADSYVRTALPSNGTYFVTVSDTQHAGGETYAYRLRVSPPMPDFALRVTPSSINIPAGRTAAICVHVLRKDGFEGAIDVRLASAPEGFELNGATIPEGRDSIRMTLMAAANPTQKPVRIQIEGRARIGEEVVRRMAEPSEDMMQAFIYRHLTPSQDLLVDVMGSRFKGRPVQVAGILPVRIPSGGSAQVLVNTPKFPELAEVRLELVEPPSGIALGEVTAQPEGLSFVLKADKASSKVGDTDNVIVEAYLNPAPDAEGKGTRKQRVSLGVLPAIPIQVVEK
ncbi:MAG: PPC domain-containing protein [Candidatus Hydrogenedentes bacterium]|nr:PPC domain-containing protein [Candidatus Hydrogenedentota bacterium]